MSVTEHKIVTHLLPDLFFLNTHPPTHAQIIAKAKFGLVLGVRLLAKGRLVGFERHEFQATET